MILLIKIVIADLVPLRQRGKYFGVVAALWALGSVTGPVIGGAIAERTTWVGFLSSSNLACEGAETEYLHRVGYSGSIFPFQ